MNWSSVKGHGWLYAEKPSASKPPAALGFTFCGVGIMNWPFGSLRFNRARATGLMFEPSAAMAVPPEAVAFGEHSRDDVVADFPGRAVIVAEQDGLDFFALGCAVF